jgi:hypothetical protein
VRTRSTTRSSLRATPRLLLQGQDEQVAFVEYPNEDIDHWDNDDEALDKALAFYEKT